MISIIKSLIPVAGLAVLASALPVDESYAQTQTKGVFNFATNVCEINVSPLDMDLLTKAFPINQYGRFFASLRLGGAGTVDICNSLVNIIDALKSEDAPTLQKAVLRGHSMSAVVMYMLLLQRRNPPPRLTLAAKDMVRYNGSIPLHDLLIIKYQESLAFAFQESFSLSEMSPRTSAFYERVMVVSP